MSKEGLLALCRLSRSGEYIKLLGFNAEQADKCKADIQKLAAAYNTSPYDVLEELNRLYRAMENKEKP